MIRVTRLWSDASTIPWKWYCLPDVIRSREPCADSVHPHSESAMWDSSVSPDINVEFVRLLGVPSSSILSRISDSDQVLSPSYYLAVSLWCEQIMAQNILGILWVWPVIEWLSNTRVVSQEVWNLEILSKDLFLGVVKVLSPIHIESLLLQVSIASSYLILGYLESA